MKIEVKGCNRSFSLFSWKYHLEYGKSSLPIQFWGFKACNVEFILSVCWQMIKPCTNVHFFVKGLISFSAQFKIIEDTDAYVIFSKWLNKELCPFPMDILKLKQICWIKILPNLHFKGFVYLCSPRKNQIDMENFIYVIPVLGLIGLRIMFVKSSWVCETRCRWF